MKTCTFFGHRDCPDTIIAPLREKIINLIEKEKVSAFYVGNQGNFDNFVIRIFKELILLYPNIKFFIVLAYIPEHLHQIDSFVSANSIIPEGIEAVPKKFAISYRNKWLVNNSDIIISYVTHTFGGAAQYVNLAKRKNKEIINLS